jgi:hypothetical protein
VLKDAKRIAGPLPMWQKDDRVWIELAPATFGKPFLLSPKIKSGIGEATVFGGLMLQGFAGGSGGPQVFEFKRVHNQVQLVARNTEVTAAAGTPEARALEASYSVSLLGSAAVASAPEAGTGAVVIEANGIFLSDLTGLGSHLQRAFRQGYSLDPRHSMVLQVRAAPKATVIETRNHYYTASLASAQPGMLQAPGLPEWVPDPRSLFVELHFSIAPLPEVPMVSRAADARVGLFTNTRLDFSSDKPRSPRQRLVNRWRLEKKEPQAELSEPVQPIVYWIDRNVPLEYRQVVSDAVLEWNKPFERIGFRNAIQVRQQPDDATFDTLDLGVASVRWMINIRPNFGAVGPRHIDPRSGEILDADVALESLSTRAMRALRGQVWPGVSTAAGPSHAPHPGHEQCQHADAMAEQLQYAVDVLASRGELDPQGPEAEAFARDYLRATVLHEIGHTLGLRHNFRASSAYTMAQLRDPVFTQANGTTASVMEYQGLNLWPVGERGGTPFQTALGPYDHWAIEYAYKVVAPEQETAELARIAARSREPLLAFGTDEDAAFGLDPEVQQFDLGDDPLAFARQRMAIATDLLRRQESRRLPPDQNWAVLRRSVGYAVSEVGRAVETLQRQIGGLRTLRDFAGSGRDPLQPVAAQTQRKALDLIAAAAFAPEALRISPALQRRLAPDFQDRSEIPGIATDFPVAQRLLELQRGALAYLMSDAVAARVLDNQEKIDRRRDAFRLSELHERLKNEVWMEIAKPRRDIVGPRRELQREHVNRLANAVLRPAPNSRADARSLMREQARELLERIELALRRSTKFSPEARAHLRDSAVSLRQTLNAPLPRAGV